MGRGLCSVRGVHTVSGADEIAPGSGSIAAAHRAGLSWPLLLGAAAFVLVLAIGAVRLDADAYWQIVAGRWIIAHGQVPARDIFSFTRHGTRWIVQEWGAEVLEALVYAMAGWAGLVLLAALCFALTIAYLARFLLARMAPLHALILTAVSGGMMLGYLIARPHELAWPLTALWVGGLIESNERKRAPPWRLLAVMLLWANLHASFILGLALAVPIALEAVIEAKRHWRPAARRWGAFLAAAFGCTLLNPQGWRLLVFPFHMLGMPVLAQLGEWQPPNLQQPQVFGLWLIGVFGLAFAGRFILPIARSLLLIALIFFALQHVRNVSLLGLISPFLIATPLAAQWRREPPHGREGRALDRTLRTPAALGGLGALCATIVLAGALGIAAVSVRKPGPPAQATPRAALDALLARRPRARILDDIEFGGYLIFRRIPVFVDPRIAVYGNAFLERYYAALDLSQRGNIDALLKKYRINAILLGPQWPLVRWLERSPRWQRVYAGKWAVAYVRARGARS